MTRVRKGFVIFNYKLDNRYLPTFNLLKLVQAFELKTGRIAHGVGKKGGGVVVQRLTLLCRPL